ncbi:hypothetical protein lerEdw1_020829 [Lerista edwardsae]|nr:hypothetical protein lerEdw1_020829 [Lerista edwardsae]
MSIGSFDDQYKDCDPGMEAKLKSPLDTDFANEEEYAKIWRDATSRWNELSYFVTSSLEPEYGIAVVAYTDDRSLCRDFNRAVEEAGRSGKAPFAFRSFHFLLTRALQILKDYQRKCYTTIRKVRGITFTIADYGKLVRFGRFTSSSLSASGGIEIATATLFIIETCFGVLIQEFSYRKDQKEVLIPPYETFRVTKVQTDEYTTFIHLSSHGRLSTYNCGVENGNSRGIAGGRGKGGQKHVSLHLLPALQILSLYLNTRWESLSHLLGELQPASQVGPLRKPPGRTRVLVSVTKPSRAAAEASCLGSDTPTAPSRHLVSGEQPN